jgi:hypothetical protein
MVLFSELDPLDYGRFTEAAWLLGRKTFTYRKIGPRYNLIIMCTVVGRQGRHFHVE